MFKREDRKSRFEAAANIFVAAVVLAGLLLLQACGGGSALPTAVPAGTLQSINITPANSLVPLGGTRQLRVTGLYSNGVKTDIAGVTWAITNNSSANSTSPCAPSCVSINSNDIGTFVKGVALGTSVISASINGLQSVTSETTVPIGLQSSTTAVLYVPFNGAEVDAAYQPQNQSLSSQGVFTVQEINLDADKLAPLPVTAATIASIPMPPGYVPNATAASQTSLKIVAISYASLDVQLIDASNDPQDLLSNTITTTLTLNLPTQSTTLNGIPCMICGIVINPANDQAVISSATGFYTFAINNYSSGTATVIPTPLATGFPAGSFSLNPANNSGYPYILSTGQGEVRLLNLGDNAVTTNTAFGITATGMAADLTHDVGVIADQNTANNVLVNLNMITNPTGATWSAPSTLVNITSGCSTPPAPLTMAAFGTGVGKQSANDVVLLTQPSGNCTAFEQFFPPKVTVGPPAISQFYYGYGGTMPPTPDGSAFVNGRDPDAIATFNSVFDNNTYGLLVNANQNWIAKIDLGGVLPQNSGDGLPLPEEHLDPLLARTLTNPVGAVIFFPTAGIVAVSPTSVDFANQTVGVSSLPSAITLTDVSATTQVSISAITIQGPNAGDFTQTNTCESVILPLGGLGLLPHGTCAITVTFAPAASGPRSATINIVNDGGVSPLSVQLKGTGS